MLPLGHEQFRDVPAAYNKTDRPIEGMGAPYAAPETFALSAAFDSPPLPDPISSSSFPTGIRVAAMRLCARTGCRQRSDAGINAANRLVETLVSAQGLRPCALTVICEVPT